MGYCSICGYPQVAECGKCHAPLCNNCFVAGKHECKNKEVTKPAQDTEGKPAKGTITKKSGKNKAK